MEDAALPEALPKALPFVPLLLRAKDAMVLLGVSRSTWDKLRAADRLPRPVSVPGLGGPRWRLTDLEAWVAKCKGWRPRRKHLGVVEEAGTDAGRKTPSSDEHTERPR